MHGHVIDDLFEELDGEKQFGGGGTGCFHRRENGHGKGRDEGSSAGAGVGVGLGVATA